jgi:chloramphenicol O-acetyltransferase type B
MFKSKAPQPPVAFITSKNPNITVGRYSYGAPRFMTYTDRDRISIGSFCSIAEEVVIFGGGEHRIDWITTYPLRIALELPGALQDGHPATKGETRIGNDVWIGYGAMILSGIVVGDGAVIGAASVVTKDVPPYGIVGGNPAKLIKHRFENSAIDELLRIRWWDWPLEKIKANVHVLCSSDVEALKKIS